MFASFLLLSFENMQLLVKDGEQNQALCVGASLPSHSTTISSKKELVQTTNMQRCCSQNAWYAQGNLHVRTFGMSLQHFPSRDSKIGFTLWRRKTCRVFWCMSKWPTEATHSSVAQNQPYLEYANLSGRERLTTNPSVMETKYHFKYGRKNWSKRHICFLHDRLLF